MGLGDVTGVIQVQLLHEVLKLNTNQTPYSRVEQEILWKTEKSMCHLYPDRDPICHMQQFQMNQFTSIFEAEVKDACQTIFKLCTSALSFDLCNYSRWNGFKLPSDESGTGFKQRGRL